MMGIARDMEGGFKTFIDKEKETADETKVSVHTFNGGYETQFDGKSIKDVGALSIVPSGSTALYDALGRTIDAVGVNLAKLVESERPNKVLFVVITDGEENASKEYTFQQVKDRITHQEGTYSWQFIFLGANIDSFAVSGSLGMSKCSTRNYVADSFGVTSAWNAMSRNYRGFRENVNYCYTANAGDDKAALNAVAATSFAFDDNAEKQDEEKPVKDKTSKRSASLTKTA